MGRLSLAEVKKTMKTEPCKGKRAMAPIPSPSNKSEPIRSQNEKNSTCDVTAVLNDGMKKLTLKMPHTENQKSDNVQIKDGRTDTDTDELLRLFPKINIAGEDNELDKKKTNLQDVKDKCGVKTETLSQTHDCDNKKTGSATEDDLCSRGPDKSDILSQQRAKTSPYQIHLTSRNRTNCGGVVYVGPSSVIGSEEESINIDQLQPFLFEDFQQQSPPPFIEQQISSGDISPPDDEVLRDIEDVMRDPKKRELMCAYLRERSEDDGCLENPSLLDVNGASHPPYSLAGDQQFLASSPLFYPGASPEQYQSQASPQQVVPSPSGWRGSYFIHSTSSSSPSSLSNPTSPSEVLSLDNPANTYLYEDIFEDFSIGKPPNNLDEVDFHVPEHPVMNTFVENVMSYGNINNNNNNNNNNNDSNNNIQLSTQHKYTPILCPPSPDQHSSSDTSKLPMKSPSGYTLSISPQTTTSQRSPVRTLSPSGCLRNISPQTSILVTSQASNAFTQNNPKVTLSQTTTQVTNQFPMASANGFTQNIRNTSSTLLQTGYVRQGVGILLPVVTIVPPQSQPQPLNRSRRQPRVLLRKETNVPSREDLLQRMDRQKKKDAWLRVNMKSKDDFTRADKDGDTLLMIVVSKEGDSMYELVYAMVEYMRRHVPEALNMKNKYGQSALYNASMLLPQHPLIPRYLAETLLSLNINIAEDTFYGLSLVECVRRRGDSHLEVLQALLNLKTAQNNPVFNI